MQRLEVQIAEADKELEIIDRLIADTAAMAEASETRLRMAKEELPQLIARREAVRAERQKALASGNGSSSPESLAAFADQLKSIDATRELCEDEIAGLTASLEQFTVVLRDARAERAKVARKVPIAKLRACARTYNAMAEKLVPVLRELWELRTELGEPHQGRAVHSPAGMVGALEAVPRLFIPGEEDFLEVSDPEKHYFFDAPGVREKRVRLVRPLTVDEEPRATEG